MLRFVITVVLLGIVLLEPSALIAHVKNPDDCDAGRNPPPGIGGNFDSPDTKFRWESDAGALTQGTICYDRFVRNRHETNRLIFDWPSAEMKSWEGVPPKGEMHYNVLLTAEFDVRKGPLFYGVAQSQVPAQVYREKEGSSAKKHRASARANYDLTILDSSGAVLALRFTIFTSISTDGNAYSYTIWNRGKQTVLLAFDPQDVPKWKNSMANFIQQNPEFAFGVPSGLRVVTDKQAVIVLPAKGETGQAVRTTRIQIYSSDQKPIAVVPYPGLFPSSQ